MVVASRQSRVVVLGAGPGGLQVAKHLRDAGIGAVILERSPRAGSFFEQFPRLRRLISLNKIHVGDAGDEQRLRWDWNSLVSASQPRFGTYDEDYHPAADSLTSYLRDFAAAHDLDIEYQRTVPLIERADGGFLVSTAEGFAYACENVVVSTGLSRPHRPEITGYDLVEEYASFPLDPVRYRDKRVLIIGKGNSAFETANWLLPTASKIHMISPANERMAAETNFPGDARSVNLAFFDTAFLKQQNAMLNGSIEKITKDEGSFSVDIVYSEDGERATMAYDAVIGCTGFTFDDSIFGANCRPEVAAKTNLPILNADWESVNVPNMFFGGSLMQANDDRASSTRVIKGIRHNAGALANIIIQKATGREWPADGAPAADLFGIAMERVRTTASLWHLWNSLCDVFVFSDAGRMVRHMRDVPQLHVFSDDRFVNDLILCLRFSHAYPVGGLDPACGEQPHGFIHPVFTLRQHGRTLNEVHFLQDVDTEWKDEEIWGGPLRLLLAFAAETSSPRRHGVDQAGGLARTHVAPQSA